MDKDIKTKYRIRVLDFAVGLAIQVSYFPLMLVSPNPWILPLTVIVGMNLAMGNFRHIYNKIKKRTLT